MTDLSNSDDIIDSRDVIERIEELEGMLPDSPEEVMPGTSEELEEIREELRVLSELAQEAEPYSDDWHYGAALIRESHFTAYSEELLKDCGMLPDDIPSFIEIDMEKTAKNMKVDYTEVEFDGVTYLIR